VQFLHNDYLSHKGHSHNSSAAAKTSNPGVYDAGVIYKSWNNTALFLKAVVQTLLKTLIVLTLDLSN
jgi:hypothetical protein